MKYILFIFYFLVWNTSEAQKFSNTDLNKLEGDFAASGQIISVSDGFLVQICEYKYGDGQVVQGWTNWVIKLSQSGKIKWKHGFDQGLSSSLMSSFIEIEDGYIGAVTQGHPELVFINKKGEIKKRLKVDSLAGIQRIQQTELGGIQFIGKNKIFEGFVPTKFNPDMVYMSTIVDFHKIELSKNWKLKSSIKIDSIEFEDDGNEYPIVNNEHFSFFLPWKNEDLYINTNNGDLKQKVPIYYNEKVKEVIYENFRINHRSNFVCSRNIVHHEPNRHLAGIEIVEFDLEGNEVTKMKVTGPLKSWNSRNDLIQTKDNGYLYLMYSDKLSIHKLDVNGKISWYKLLMLPEYYLHMSIAENDQGDIFVLTLKKGPSGTKPYVMQFTSTGELQN